MRLGSGLALAILITWTIPADAQGDGPTPYEEAIKAADDLEAKERDAAWRAYDAALDLADKVRSDAENAASAKNAEELRAAEVAHPEAARAFWVIFEAKGTKRLEDNAYAASAEAARLAEARKVEADRLAVAAAAEAKRMAAAHKVEAERQAKIAEDALAKAKRDVDAATEKLATARAAAR